MSKSKDHPLMAKVYVKMADEADEAGGTAHRKELLAGLTGHVLEVGAGDGRSFALYPDTVTELVAIEPEPSLRALAEQRAATIDLDVHILDATAETLPCPDASMDAVVTSLVLCGVDDLGGALTEIARVLKPGGQLRFYEHVRANSVGLRTAQQVADVVWSRLGWGCHLSRATIEAIEASALELTEVRRFRFAPTFAARMASPHVIGTAVRPTT